MKRFFLGVDVSTTGAKALLINDKGQVVASATTALSLQTPQPLWSEQDPREWWSGTVASIRKVLKEGGIKAKHVTAVGLTGQMHGLVLLDGDRNVLRPAILWNDQRTGAECDEIHRRVGQKELVQEVGNVALTGFTAPKILWVRKNEPSVYEKAKLVLLPKDYVRLRLSGEAGMDKADGSGTILFDLKARGWSKTVLEKLDIPPEWLPPTFEGPETTGQVTAEAAEATGLAEGTPIMAGGGDQAAGAVGAGAVRPGVVSLTLGTSGVIFATTEAPLVEPEGRLHAFCHAVPGKWHFMGVTLSAAGSLQWYHDALTPSESFDSIVSEAEGAPAGSEGLVFLPYLSGERTPYPDPLARGGFVGLTLRHGRAHMTRSVLEGVAFSMKDCFGLLKGAGLGEVSEVRIAGGGAKGALWRKIVASALGLPMVTVTSSEGAAYGAALLGGVGAGAWTSVEEACAATIQVTGRDEPVAEWTSAYDELYPSYQALYPALKPTFHALGG